MNEQMEFPNTFDEFADYYGFKDSKEIYTNGSMLIPIFRVKQWLNHIPNNSENMTVEQYRTRMIEAFQNADCNNLIVLVSLPTEKEFEHLEWLLKNYYKKQSNSDEDCISRAELIGKTIKKNSIWLKITDSRGMNLQEIIDELPSVQPKPKTDVLDKIRAEIIQMPTISFNTNDIYKADVLQIIDKYKAESEEV